MDEVRYFESTLTDPPTLLRRSGVVDEAFIAGEWRHSEQILRHMFGKSPEWLYVEPIATARAQELAPAAFAGQEAQRRKRE